MAYLYGTVAQGALTANTTQTWLEWKPSANLPHKMTLIEASFDGSSAGAGIRVQLIRQSTDGTGAATPPTPQKKDPNSRSAQITTLWKLSAEGTLDAVLGERYVQPFGGLWLLQWPLDQEWWANEGGNRLALRIITPASVAPNCIVNGEHEE